MRLPTPTPRALAQFRLAELAEFHRITIEALSQVEALLMTVAGGIVGMLLGCGVAVAISSFAGWATYVSANAIGLALAVSLAVGLGFGTYPGDEGGIARLG